MPASAAAARARKASFRPKLAAWAAVPGADPRAGGRTGVAGAAGAVGTAGSLRAPRVPWRGVSAACMDTDSLLRGATGFCRDLSARRTADRATGAPSTGAAAVPAGFATLPVGFRAESAAPLAQQSPGPDRAAVGAGSGADLCALPASGMASTAMPLPSAWACSPMAEITISSADWCTVTGARDAAAAWAAGSGCGATGWVGTAAAASTGAGAGAGAGVWGSCVGGLAGDLSARCGTGTGLRCGAAAAGPGCAAAKLLPGRGASGRARTKLRWARPAGELTATIRSRPR